MHKDFATIGDYTAMIHFNSRQVREVHAKLKKQMRHGKLICYSIRNNQNQFIKLIYLP